MFYRLTAGLAAFSTNFWPPVVGEAMLSGKDLIGTDLFIGR